MASNENTKSTASATAPAAAPAPADVQPAPSKSLVKSFLAGGFGGMCLVAVGHPFDLVKVRLQTSNEYSGMLDCVRKSLARDGLRGMYRGMATPLIGATPVFAVCFWGYDVGKRIVQAICGKDAGDAGKDLSIAQTAAAGALSAVPTTILMTPMERIKCVLQVDKSYGGPWDATRGILRAQGPRGLFTGAPATLLRDGIGSVGYFVAYEVVKNALTPDSAKADGGQGASFGAILVAGGAAGMANWSLAIPLDVLKSRQQTAPPGTYSGLRDVLVKTVRSEGPGALLKGLGPAMARAFPANAACFMGVEMAHKCLDKLW